MTDTHVLLKIQPIPHNTGSSLSRIRKIIIPVSPTATIKLLKSEISNRFQKLFETSVTIKYVCDSNDFVLDDEIFVQEAFAQSDVAKVECQESNTQTSHSSSLKRKQPVNNVIVQQNSKRNRLEEQVITKQEDTPDDSSDLESGKEQEDVGIQESDSITMQPIKVTEPTTITEPSIATVKQTETPSKKPQPQQNALKPAKLDFTNSSETVPKKDEKKQDNRQKPTFSPQPKTLTVNTETVAVRPKHIQSPIATSPVVAFSPKSAPAKEDAHKNNDSESDEDTMNFLLNKNPSKQQQQPKMTITVQQRKSNSTINTKMPISPLFSED